MNSIISQTIGVGGMILCLCCYHVKSRKNLLLTKLAADILWAIHYFMIGGMPGFAINAICSVRETVYLIDKNEKHRPVQLAVFIVANWIVQLCIWKDATSLLPIFVATLGSYSFWQKNVNVTRIIALIIAALMFTYDIFVMSYAGLLSEGLTFFSALSAIIINRKTKE